MKTGKVVSLTVLAGVIILASLYLMKTLFLFFIALIVALILHPAVRFLRNLNLTNTQATVIVFAGVLIGQYLLFANLIPILLEQSAALIRVIENSAQPQNLLLLETKIRLLFPFLPEHFLTAKLEIYLDNFFNLLLTQLSSIISNVFSFLGIVFIIPFITFFILKDRYRLLKSFIAALPNKFAEPGYSVLISTTDQLGKYVRGWIFDAAFVGTAAGIGFSLLGIQNAAALGIVAGIGHLVPFLGPLIGGLPAFLIATAQYGDFSHSFSVIALLGFIYLFDNGFMQPYIFSKATNLPTLLILLLLPAGNEFAGPLGMIVVIPLATIIKSASSEIIKAYKNYSIIRQI